MKLPYSAHSPAVKRMAGWRFLPRIGGLSNLLELRLDGNALSGDIPAELGGLRALLDLYLGGNDGLSGCVPDALRSVEYHDLDDLGMGFCR